MLRALIPFLFVFCLAPASFFAKTFKPNVYECKGKDFTLTYSEATSNGQFIKEQDDFFSDTEYDYSQETWA